MTTITLNRAIVEQALEALKDDQYRLVEVGPNQYEYKTDLAIAALERALAQQAEPRNQCRSDGRCQYAIDHGAEGMGHCPKGKCVMAQHTQPAEDRAVAQSNLRVMKEMFREQAEPVAKVELMTTGGNAGLATRIVEIDDHLRERLRPGQLLYTAPPQRKPLTEEEILRVKGQFRGTMNAQFADFARAIERKVRGEEK